MTRNRWTSECTERSKTLRSPRRPSATHVGASHTFVSNDDVRTRNSSTVVRLIAPRNGMKSTYRPFGTPGAVRTGTPVRAHRPSSAACVGVIHDKSLREDVHAPRTAARTKKSPAIIVRARIPRSLRCGFVMGFTCVPTRRRGCRGFIDVSDSSAALDFLAVSFHRSCVRYT